MTPAYVYMKIPPPWGLTHRISHEQLKRCLSDCADAQLICTFAEAMHKIRASRDKLLL